MPADRTRNAFDPLLDRALVLHQQGRVHTDADLNELATLLERRIRVETRDVVGPAAYPAVLDESFKITAGGGGLQIGRGRIYVDGLLAENHGVGATEHEPVWDEPRGALPTPVSKQPYAGTPIAIAGGGGAAPLRQLVYLDVWHRERTWVEEPELVDPAIGVDTTARIQTAWQVRAIELSDPDQLCSGNWDGVGEWQALIKPSGARLTTRAVGTPDPSDPCAVAPVGGYRGVHNQLYRVEVHHGGAAGKVTLKWSRDNGSVASPVTSVTDDGTDTTIEVVRVGRDDVLRFHPGDWVELLDDVLELDGKPGVLAQVKLTDEDRATVTVKGVHTGAVDLARRARLRRWDQREPAGKVDPATGLIPVGASPTAFTIDRDIEVTIDLTAGDAKVGDWWIFAARPETGAIEELTAEPPMGVRHHYARLAILANGEVIDDCRVPWPGDCHCEDDCACTRCVTPESHDDDEGPMTIQRAIDEVIAAGGGRVCIAPGRYRLKQTVTVRDAHGLSIVGELGATVLLPDPEVELGIFVESSSTVLLEGLSIGDPDAAHDGDEGTGGPQVAGIALVSVSGMQVRRCRVSVGDRTIGVALAGSILETTLDELTIVAGIAIGDLVARSLSPAMEKEVLVAAPTGVAEAGSDLAGYVLFSGLRITRSVLAGRLHGIVFGDSVQGDDVEKVLSILAGEVLIDDNSIVGEHGVGVGTVGWVQQPAQPGEISAGLVPGAQFGARGARLEISRNQITGRHYGVLASPLRTWVTDNVVESMDGVFDSPESVGILLRQAVDEPQPADWRVSGNAVTGFGGSGIALVELVGDGRVVGNAVRDVSRDAIAVAGGRDPDGLLLARADVLDNTVERVVVAGKMGSIVGIMVDRLAQAQIARNRILRVGDEDLSAGFNRFGIRTYAVDVAEIADNTIAQVDGKIETKVVGISVEAASQVGVRGNVVSVGSAEGGGIALQIPGRQEITLEARATARPAEGDLRRLAAGFAGGINPAKVSGLLDPVIERLPIIEGLGDDILVHVPPLHGEPVPEPHSADELPELPPQVSAVDNDLSVGGTEPAVVIEGRADCTFNANRCVAPRPSEETPGVVIVVEGTAVVTSNNITAVRRPAALTVESPGGAGWAASVVGNVVRGRILLGGAPLAAPWKPINVQLL